MNRTYKTSDMFLWAFLWAKWLQFKHLEPWIDWVKKCNMVFSVPEEIDITKLLVYRDSYDSDDTRNLLRKYKKLGGIIADFLNAKNRL